MSAINDDPQGRALALAAALSPIIEQHLDAARRSLPPRMVPVRDEDLIRAASQVAEALGKLETQKYTRGEIAARMALERQAKALRQVLKGRRT